MNPDAPFVFACRTLNDLPMMTAAVCEACRRDVYLGPRQQERRETLPPSQCSILCLACAALATAVSPVEVEVHNLGNPLA